MNLNKNTNYAVSFLDPEKIIFSLDIQPEMKVAHFGCGTGFFTFPTAKKVGEEGLVYAFDILQEKIETVASRAKLDGFYNILPQRVNLEKEKGTGLENASIDWVFIVNMLYENSQKNNILQEAGRILKEDGKILLIDWENSDSSLGPEIKSRISQSELRNLIEKNDFAILEKIKVGSFHFGWILSK